MRLDERDVCWLAPVGSVPGAVRTVPGVSVEERLEAIESKVAYQDRAIDELGEALGKLHERVRRLELAVKHLGERLDTAPGGPPPAPEDELPPHY